MTQVTGVAWVLSLAWELLCAMGKVRKKERKKRIFSPAYLWILVPSPLHGTWGVGREGGR